MRIRISDIKIPERFRVDYGDLKELAESIDTYGLIQPIVVTRSGSEVVLVAGARRLLACLQLQQDEIETVSYEELDETTRREIELEENIKRKQFTWQEEVRAKAELLKLRQLKAKKGFWADKPEIAMSVADELGESDATLSQDIQLAEAMVRFPELAKEETKTGAFKKYKRLILRSALETISKTLTAGEDLWIYNSDCREELKNVPSESVGLVLTDPPWGVDVFEISDRGMETFDDSEEEAFRVLEEVLPEIKRVLKRDCHAYFFFATKHYVRTFNLLSKFFEVEPIPRIWVKPNALNTAPQAHPTWNYETIFWCKKGERRLYKPSMAAVPYPVPTEKIHPTQKPLELIEELIEVSTIPGEVVLDPFAGSGVVGKAALKLKRKVILVEKDPDIFNAMKVHIVKKEEE